MQPYRKHYQLQKSKSLDNFYPLHRNKNNIFRQPTALKIEPLLQPPRKNMNCLQNNKEQSVRQLKRMKSVENFKQIPQNCTLQNLAQFYKLQNQNLKKQNKFLVGQIRKRKNNQETLCNYIRNLQQQIKKLQDIAKIAPPKQKIFTKYFYSDLTGKQQIEILPSTKRTITQQSSVTTLATQMQQLNYKFNNLMEKCSRQSNKKVKNVLRTKIAQTAQKMRNFKKQQLVQ